MKSKDKLLNGENPTFRGAGKVISPKKTQFCVNTLAKGSKYGRAVGREDVNAGKSSKL